VKSTNNFIITHIDPTWAKGDELKLNAVDRTHFHIGIKIELHTFLSNKKQSKVITRKLASEYLAKNQNSNDSYILNEIAYIYRDIFKNPQMAIKYYLKAIEKYEPAKEPEEGSANPLLEAINLLGDTYFETKKYDEALKLFARFVKDYSKDFDAPYALEKIAKIYLIQKNYQKAIETFQKIIDDYAEHIMADDAYFALGSIYLQHKISGDRSEDQKKACAIFQAGAQKYPHGDRIDDLHKKIKALRCAPAKAEAGSSQPTSSPATEENVKEESE